MSDIYRWLLMILLPGFLTAQSQVVLNADGPGNTYELLSAVLGGTPYEVPDCAHPSFGRHIAEAWDDELQENVFLFYIHRDEDNDRCINFDRQRNEIKTYDQSPPNLLGTEGETHIYRWKFRLDSAFQASPNFTHVFQIKPRGGNDDSNPLITITLRSSNPDRLEIRHAASNSSQVTVATAELEALKGKWLTVTCRALYRDNGKLEMRITTPDSTTVLWYQNYLLDMWRAGADFNRPKWGIYRSLNSPSFLRDETLRFAGFTIEEPAPNPAPSAPTQLTATTVSPGKIELNWLDTSTNETNFLIQRSDDGVSWNDHATVNADITTFSDIFLPANTTYYYRVRAENWEANSAFSNIDSANTTPTGIEDTPSVIPGDIELQQNYPNPFNPTTTIRYATARNGFVQLEILDSQGRLMQTLVREMQPAGIYRVVWNAEQVASGVYYYRLRLAGAVLTRKMLLVR